jgi:hypothetical protein
MTSINAIPNVTTAERDSDLTSVPDGALIYNETTSRMEYTTDGGSTWEQVSDVADIPVDTTAYGETYFQDNATDTVISIIDTPVKVNASYSSGDLLGFTQAAGTLTYTASETKQFLLSLSLNTAINLASDKVSVIIYVNGAPLAKSKQSHFTGSTSPGLQSLSINAIVSLSTGDTVEVFMENNTSVNNIVVQDLNLNVSAIGGMIGSGSGNQVVTSWDGSTSPVGVTAGSNIDITGGVISSTASAVDHFIKLGTVTSPRTSYTTMVWQSVWNTLQGTNSVVAGTFDIGDTVKIEIDGIFDSNVVVGTLGQKGDLRVSFGSIIVNAQAPQVDFATFTGQYPFKIVWTITRLTSTTITSTFNGWYINSSGVMTPYNILINPVSLTYDDSITNNITVEFMAQVTGTNTFDFIAKNLNIVQYS